MRYPCFVFAKTTNLYVLKYAGSKVRLPSLNEQAL
jgi:hypothetical protein